MTKFRWHRGGLDESMATVIDVESFEHLRLLIQERDQRTFPDMPVTIEMKVEPYGFDDRINWNTYIVTKRIVEANESFMACGFTNGPLFREVQLPDAQPNVYIDQFAMANIDPQIQYRECMTPGCGQRFRIQAEDSWLCEVCTNKALEKRRQDRVAESVNRANRRAMK